MPAAVEAFIQEARSKASLNELLIDVLWAWYLGAAALVNRSTENNLDLGLVDCVFSSTVLEQ